MSQGFWTLVLWLFLLVDLNLLHAKHIKKLRRACKLSSTGLTRTVTARGTCLLHSYPQLSTVLMIEVEIYFRWEHVGALSLFDFHLQQIWPGTLSTDELRRALCGVGLKTADAPQRNRTRRRKPWKTWKHDETCGRSVVWQCIWALDSESNCFVALCQVMQVTKIYKVMVTGLEFCAASLVILYKNRRTLDLSDCVLHDTACNCPRLSHDTQKSEHTCNWLQMQTIRDVLVIDSHWGYEQRRTCVLHRVHPVALPWKRRGRIEEGNTNNIWSTDHRWSSIDEQTWCCDLPLGL